MTERPLPAWATKHNLVKVVNGWYKGCQGRVAGVGPGVSGRSIYITCFHPETMENGQITYNLCDMYWKDEDVVSIPSSLTRLLDGDGVDPVS